MVVSWGRNYIETTFWKLCCKVWSIELQGIARQQTTTHSQILAAEGMVCIDNALPIFRLEFVSLSALIATYLE
jgi:hypothetical protein